MQDNAKKYQELLLNKQKLEKQELNNLIKKQKENELQIQSYKEKALELINTRKEVFDEKKKKSKTAKDTNNSDSDNNNNNNVKKNTKNKSKKLNKHNQLNNEEIEDNIIDNNDNNESVSYGEHSNSLISYNKEPINKNNKKKLKLKRLDDNKSNNSDIELSNKKESDLILNDDII